MRGTVTGSLPPDSHHQTEYRQSHSLTAATHPTRESTARYSRSSQQTKDVHSRAQRPRACRSRESPARAPSGGPADRVLAREAFANHVVQSRQRKQSRRPKLWRGLQLPENQQSSRNNVAAFRVTNLRLRRHLCLNSCERRDRVFFLTIARPPAKGRTTIVREWSNDGDRADVLFNGNVSRSFFQDHRTSGDHVPDECSRAAAMPPPRVPRPYKDDRIVQSKLDRRIRRTASSIVAFESLFCFRSCGPNWL